MRETLVKSEEFKDSSVGRIPKDWQIFQLSEIIEGVIDFRGKTPKKIGMEWGNGEIPALSANNVEMGRINFNKETYYASEKLYQKWMNKGDTAKGDVILTTEAPLGNIAQIPDNRKYILSQRVLLLKTKSNLIFNSFLKYYLMSDCFQSALRKNSTGTTATGIQQAKLIKIPVVLPPIQEQQVIAEVLENIDQAIAHTSSLIAKLKLMKAGLLHDLLTRGLDENGELRDAIAHPEQFKDSSLGQIPKEWEVVQLESLAELITSGSRGWAAYYSDQGAIFIRIGNLTREHLNFRLNDIVYVNPPSSSEGSRARLQAGDVLISITADLGIIGVVPENFGEAYVNQHIALVRLDQSKANSWWVGNYLSGEVGQKKFYQLNDVGAKAGLNLPTIGALLVALPPMQEQEKIAAIIKNYDTRIRAEEAYRDKLKLQKQGLMHDLLTGKVRVKNA
jgi:type I restriction enzyme S subunit